MISARLQRRWWLRQLACFFGVHGWGMGPFSMEGDKEADLLYRGGRVVPEACMFMSPWCHAKRIVPKDAYPPQDWRTRLGRWAMHRRYGGER